MSISSMTNAAIARRVDFASSSAAARDLQAIATGAGTAAPTTSGDGVPPKATPIDTALHVLFGYIPTEVITVYLAVVAALQPSASAGSGCPVANSWTLAFWIFLSATPLVVWIVFAGKLRAAGKPLPAKPSLWPVWEMCAGTIAFAAWAIALPNNPFKCAPWYNSALAALAVLIVSTVLGLVAPLFSKPLSAA